MDACTACIIVLFLFDIHAQNGSRRFRVSEYWPGRSPEWQVAQGRAPVSRCGVVGADISGVPVHGFAWGLRRDGTLCHRWCVCRYDVKCEREILTRLVGDSLIQMVLDDQLLAMGRSGGALELVCASTSLMHYVDPSFQLAHAVYRLERILNDFTTQSAVFDIVFWNELRHLTLRTGDIPWVTQSRAVARALLIQHLHSLDVEVLHFESVEDHEWLKYRSTRKVSEQGPPMLDLPTYYLVSPCSSW
jgi:hypothetical protein